MIFEDEFEQHGKDYYVGYLCFLQLDFTSKITCIIIHSFDNIENCISWLDRNGNTTEDCCLRMGELLMFGDSF